MRVPVFTTMTKLKTTMSVTDRMACMGNCKLRTIGYFNELNIIRLYRYKDGINTKFPELYLPLFWKLSPYKDDYLKDGTWYHCDVSEAGATFMYIIENL